MLRLAPASAGFLAAVLLACSTPPAPAPTKISETSQTGTPPPSQPIPSPFINPDKHPPPPRSEPQLPPAELAAVLAKADQERLIGNVAEASLTLQGCANKVPQSVRCEGELGALVARMPSHRYEAEYYLKQAIDADDSTLDADYYRRLGDALQARGKYEDAATAFTRMIERSKPATAADHYQLAVVLQGVPSRIADATEALRRAYEQDPTQHAWLRDQAILLGQQANKLTEAIALFEQFKTKTQDPEMIADTDRRLGELKSLLGTDAAPTKETKGKAKPRKQPKPAG